MERMGQALERSAQGWVAFPCLEVSRGRLDVTHSALVWLTGGNQSRAGLFFILTDSQLCTGSIRSSFLFHKPVP